jgi:hypothetical protein
MKTRNALMRIAVAVLVAASLPSCALVEDTANAASNLVLGRDVEDCFVRRPVQSRRGAAQPPVASAIELRQVEIVDSMGKGGLE